MTTVRDAQRHRRVAHWEKEKCPGCSQIIGISVGQIMAVDGKAAKEDITKVLRCRSCGHLLRGETAVQ